jgi:fibro-slime domain-containing protein
MTCYGLLALAGGVSLLMPESVSIPAAQAQSGPSEYTITGLVRDFLSSHPDFNIFPPVGFGHYAGNVDTVLDPVTGRPVYNGKGFKVRAEWRDADGNPIAPHMFNVFDSTACGSGPGLAVNGLVDVGNSSTVDSYDSRLGAYGGDNVGANALLSTNSTDPDMMRNVNHSTINGSVQVGPGGDPAVVYDTSPNSILTGTVDSLLAAVDMPVVGMPENVGPSTGDRLYGPGTTDVLSDMHVDTLTMQSGAVLVMHGDRTVVCDGDFVMDGTGADVAEIRLAPGATLQLFVQGDVDVRRGRVNMNTGDPTRCTVNKLGPGMLRLLNNQSAAAARFVAPDGTMVVRQSSEAFGSFVGESLVMDNNGVFHVDDALRGGDNPEDVAGLPAVPSGEAITSPATYDQWFREVLGTNMSKHHEITLVQNANGVYEYLNSGFYPIDGQLLGNEGGTRNDYYTFAIDAEFTYDACTGQFVEFQGGDGVWIFVNDQMVIDLGGVTPFTTQRIDLDRLDLADGETARLRLYFAHRNFFSAVFRLRTNLELATPSIPTVSAIFD